MAFPSLGGGYQLTDGNVNELRSIVVPAPQTATATATLSTAQVMAPMLVANPGTTAASYTLPTAAALEAAMVNPKVDNGFDYIIVNLGTTAGAVTVVAGTGWTLVGSATVAVTSSATFRARKTADNAWTLYRIA